MIVVAVCFLVVSIAMFMDLMAGLYKAHLIKEVRTSEGLRRTANKMIVYYGSICMAAGGDVVIFLSNFYDLIGLPALHSYPLISALVSLFLLACEFLSLREKADKKTQRRQAEARKLIIDLLKSDETRKLVESILEKRK